MESGMIVYKITSPSGKCYVGITKNSIERRFKEHVRRSKKGTNHPFYNAIRKYGGDNFILEVIEYGLNLQEAKIKEIEYIAKYKDTCGVYNISRGGDYDEVDGSKKFWSEMTPEYRKRYLKKLSEVKKSRDWTDYELLAKKAEEWRINNPRRAYKISTRNSRIALRKMGVPTYFERVGSRCSRLDMPSRVKRILSARKQWAKRSEDEIKSIGKKISEGLKNRNAALSIEEKEKADKQLSEVRKHIDIKRRSDRIRESYERLKNDPVRYAEYLEKRRKSREKKSV